MIRRLWLSILFLPVLLLAACGGSANTPTTTATTSSSGTSTGSAVVNTAVSTSSASSAASSTTSSTAATSTTAAASPSGAGSTVGGTTFTLDASQSQAMYKARETLANIGSPTDAVGKTSQVSGRIVFTGAGAIDSSASKITIDLSTLQSDKSQRDNYIKRNTLNTNQYPDAVFVPTSVQGLSWPLPTSGQQTFTLVGNLTAHGVTAPTTWKATATFGPQQIKGSATTTVKFEDFGMKPPSTMLVLSVEDNLTLELDFVFTPGS